jgi:hypothetical protein
MKPNKPGHAGHQNSHPPPNPKQQKNKSLFASFSSEKEDSSFFLYPTRNITPTA